MSIDPTPFAKASSRPDLAAAKKWAADPAHTEELFPKFRHILVQANPHDPASDAAARTKIDGLLARLVAGEDFAKLAIMSDDPGSASNGGAYEAERVRSFVPEVRRAYTGLRPGSFTHEPVKSTFGWHIVAKDALDDDSTRASYTQSMARHTAEKIAQDLHERLRHVGPEGVKGALAQAFTAWSGRAPDNLPKVFRLPADTPASALASTCQDLGSMAQDGKVRADANEQLMVATITDDPPDPSEVERGECSANWMADAIHTAIVSHHPVDTTGWTATATRPSRLFEVVRIDDTDDVVGLTPPSSQPKDAVVQEFTATLGPSGATARRTTVGFPRSTNETDAAVPDRGRKWLATVKHPAGTFFLLKTTRDPVVDKRSYFSVLARDPVIVDERDIAKVSLATTPEGRPFVQVDLHPPGAKRLADAKLDWEKRRLAIVVNGVVVAAPIVANVLPSGRVDIAPPEEDSRAETRASVERLVRTLSGTR